MKKTGIELISEERNEQIEKHGWSIENDSDYGSGQLLKAALFCINQTLFEWPWNWTEQFRKKIIQNDRISQLKKAGAFIAAEIDRLQALE